jgi:hypothetical protein
MFIEFCSLIFFKNCHSIFSILKMYNLEIVFKAFDICLRTKYFELISIKVTAYLLWFLFSFCFFDSKISITSYLLNFI